MPMLPSLPILTTAAFETSLPLQRYHKVSQTRALLPSADITLRNRCHTVLRRKETQEARRTVPRRNNGGARRFAPRRCNNFSWPRKTLLADKGGGERSTVMGRGRARVVVTGGGVPRETSLRRCARARLRVRVGNSVPVLPVRRWPL